MSAAHSCARCATVIEEGDLRCCICGVVAPARQGGPMREVQRIVRCHECGAAVVHRAEDAMSPACRFCRAPTAIETPTNPLEVAELMLPFAVSADRAVGAMRRYLGSLGFFRPSDLAASATVDSVTAVWFASWIFDVRADVSWAADSDAGSGRSAWAPHAGRVKFDWRNVLVSASRGLAYHEVARLAPAYDLRQAQAVAGSAVAQVESFDVDRSAARQRILDAIHAIAAGELEKRHIPGSRFRKVAVSALLEGLTTRRCALPAYVFVYRYEGRPYRAIVHGQNEGVAFGTAPLSWSRIALVALAVVAVIAAVLALLALR
jgi:hypothetical protein